MPNSRKTLYETKQFRMALWGPILAATVLAAIIIATSPLDWRLDYVGVNNLLIYFKVPLYIASLAFPLVALVATNHRSEQSKKQIEITMEQNKNSIKPAIGFNWDTIEPRFKVEIANKGAGLAKIEEFQFLNNGKEITYNQLWELMPTGNRDIVSTCEIAEMHEGEYFAKDETLVVIHLELSKQNPELYASFFKLIKNVSLRVKYTSLYGDEQEITQSFDL